MNKLFQAIKNLFVPKYVVGNICVRTIFESDNPFKPPLLSFYKILEIKQGWFKLQHCNSDYRNYGEPLYKRFSFLKDAKLVCKK